jgi:hypothetical protein
LLRSCANLAARFPISTVAIIALLSMGVLIVSIYVSPPFGIPLAVDDQFASRFSNIVEQSRYLYRRNEGGFVGRYRYFSLLLHGGVEEYDTNTNTTNTTKTNTTTTRYKDILHSDFIEKAFTAVETIRSLPGYREMCTQKKVKYMDPVTKQFDCEVYAVTRHWQHDVQAYRQSVVTAAANTNNSSNIFMTKETIPAILSRNFFPDGQPASKQYLYGRYEIDDATKIMTRLEMTNIIFFLPVGSIARNWENEIGLPAALQLRELWQKDEIVLEVSAESSLQNEFARTITDDIPLVGVIFIVMSAFTALTQWRCSGSNGSCSLAPVHSRALLGVGAVVTVLLSMCAGFGIMFMIAVPFSNLTMILPFIIFVRLFVDNRLVCLCCCLVSFSDKQYVLLLLHRSQGVGLDDAFILMYVPIGEMVGGCT